jgi:O-antigen ligase
MYLGLLTYCVLLYLRPGDWVEAVLNWPLEFAVILVTAGIGLLRRVLSDAKPAMPPQIPLLGLWIVAVILSNATTMDMASTVFYGWEFTKRAIIFLMFWVTVRTTTQLRGVCLLLVVLAGLLGMQGIYQVGHGIGWAGQPMYWGGRIRWVGLWDGANVLSLLFVIALPLAIDMVIGRWSLMTRLIAAPSLVLLTIGLFLAASRGAWIAAGATLLLYFRNRMGKAGFVIGAMVVAGMVVFGPERLSHLGVAGTDADTESAAGRVSMWAEGLEMFKYNPVFGIGKGHFAAYTGSLIAHNTFVQNMGETGMLGLFAWVGLIYVSIRGLRAACAVDSQVSAPLRATAGALLAAFTGYLAASFFITTDFEPLYILMALSAIVVEIGRREAGLSESLFAFGVREMRTVAALSASGVVVMYIVTAMLSN